MPLRLYGSSRQPGRLHIYPRSHPDSRKDWPFLTHRSPEQALGQVQPTVPSDRVGYPAAGGLLLCVQICPLNTNLEWIPLSPWE